jgi:hypothetical protein
MISTSAKFQEAHNLDTLPPHREHIPLHRLWVYLKGEGEMALPERVHVATCDDCEEVFRACIHAKTFGAVLMSLERKESA